MVLFRRYSLAIILFYLFFILCVIIIILLFHIFKALVNSIIFALRVMILKILKEKMNVFYMYIHNYRFQCSSSLFMVEFPSGIIFPRAWKNFRIFLVKIWWWQIFSVFIMGKCFFILGGYCLWIQNSWMSFVFPLTL